MSAATRSNRRGLWYLDTRHGRFRVVDFSRSGFRIIGPVFIGQKVTLLVELQTFAAATNDSLKAHLLQSFYVEVRWSRQVAGGYEHGVKLFGLNPEQRQQVFTHLEDLYSPQLKAAN